VQGPVRDRLSGGLANVHPEVVAQRAILAAQNHAALGDESPDRGMFIRGEREEVGLVPECVKAA
jgi:hypothetical protein